MKKLLLIFTGLLALTLFFIYGFQTEAQAVGAHRPGVNLVSTSIVISQFYGGGGTGATAPYTSDYVELFNRGASAVSLNGWSTQYASSAGSNWLVTPLTNVTLQPGQYYLIQYASGTTITNPLPSPDMVAPPVTSGGNTFVPNLSGTTGKVALVTSITQLPAVTCPTDSSIVDLVGYGSANCSEGSTTSSLSNTTAGARKGGGCTDTDNNSADFTVGAPNPRNTLTAPIGCSGGGGENLFASISANPISVAPGSNTLLTVTVVPATTPPSTGITVTGNLSAIAGSASQTFFDDGTNGDATAGDNVFSYLATVPAIQTAGNYVVTAVAADAQARTVNLNQNLNVSIPFPDEDPLLFGNPSGATSDIANENNYLMVKPQYTLSYNRSSGTPNWVAWRLDSSWVGGTPRQDDYRNDITLPAGWYQVLGTDYQGSGYDRGHMCPSGDRTRSVPDNSATFLMTNFVPQLSANNQGSWEEFETYCRTLASQGSEIYIVDGPVGNIGMIAAEHVVVPQYTWKVVLIMPNGSDDLHRAGKEARAFGIIVPNFPPLDINTPWRQFRVTVGAVENLTGYKFFTELPKITQSLIKRRHDIQ